MEESPYPIFGDNTAVLQTKHEDKKDHTLKIPIVENNNQIGLFKMDFQTGIVSIEDDKGDNAPHFGLARPGGEADNKIKQANQYLLKNGVR